MTHCICDKSINRKAMHTCITVRPLVLRLLALGAAGGGAQKKMVTGVSNIFFSRKLREGFFRAEPFRVSTSSEVRRVKCIVESSAEVQSIECIEF